MLNRDRVVQAFDAKKDKFQAFWQERARTQKTLEEVLTEFTQETEGSLLAYLATLGDVKTGARPTDELDRAKELHILFAQQWQGHRDSRTWAMNVLRDRPVLAVDGSQVVPTKDFSIPVGAVQIGWFLNEHREGGSYIKDVEFELLTPQELMDEEEGGGDGQPLDETNASFAGWRVNQERFVRECEKICELMVRYADRPQNEKPICFFDGSFIISFASQVKNFSLYIKSVTDLLHCSQKYHVPLVGFIDTSQSHDVQRLIGLRTGIFLPMNDAALFDRIIGAQEWGSRSPVFICDRDDTLNRKQRVKFYNDVTFTYMRLSQERSPVRLEMPRWMMEEGLVEDVLNIVRAECIVGSGYPYAIETADALCVISQQDRQRFYGLFQRLIENNVEGATFTQARKARSKLGRR